MAPAFMKIEFSEVAKRYRREWVLRNIDLQLSAPGTYAVTGPNGVGKSTFLRLLSGYLTPSKGKIKFTAQGKTITSSEVYKHLALAAPYVDVIEEYTLEEALRFHQQFKTFAEGLTPQVVMEDILGLEKHKNKPIRHFSSGMKQRLKLALAVCSQTPVLLLDEPTTNLDRQGANWYHNLLEKFSAQRLVVVASNVDEDMAFCTHRINILDYK
jgi:ABC-type multidrug transport system ATPase subunit